MVFSKNISKHIEQIKIGGIKVLLKKIKSFVFLVLQLPFYLLAIPSIIIIRLIKPWKLIRWQEINSGRIGHFTVNTELYCCERDAKINLPTQKYIDLFYLRKYVCNKQLEKMWRRSIIILPFWIMKPLFRVNRFLNIFIPGGEQHEISYLSTHMCGSLLSCYDLHNLLGKFTQHINFNDEEEIKGKNFLRGFGLPDKAKFVCLNVRDSAYLDRYKDQTLRDFSYHNYRDGDIDKFILSAEELTKRGYYVFRMGVKVLKPIKINNPKIIDYANSNLRSAFMDIYLSAKCNFCVATGSGIDEVSRIFGRPIANICMPLALQLFFGGHEKELVITKHHINKKNNNKLTVSEIFLFNLALAFYSKDFEKNGVELIDNSPEEIRDLVIEMDDRLNGNWIETKEDLLLQEKFKDLFKENLKKLKLKIKLNSEIKANFGTKYLRQNPDWIQ